MTTKTRTIPYYNLREEITLKRLPAIVGREAQVRRLDRLIGRRLGNNALIVGPAGCGKTALAWGWMRHLSVQRRCDAYALLQFDADHISMLGDDASLDESYGETLASVPRSVILIDDFGREISNKPALAERMQRLYKPLLARPDVHVVLTLLSHEYTWLLAEYPAFANQFEHLSLDGMTDFEYARILRKKMPALNPDRRVVVTDDVLEDAVSLARRYAGALGALPRSAINLLDESLSLCAAERGTVLSRADVALVIEAKTGVPAAGTAQAERDNVKHLGERLSERVIGQNGPINTIVTTLQRAKLGLRDPNRPLGSFLMLGPSGVGKTESAKALAEIVLGRSECFTRIDMSEFQQEHMVQRLIGAPPGYVGYEEGGALTNALKREPHSLILLDEIEKAHPKVFDIFLQVLDDGRLTSGQGETIDAKDAIIMATSNAAVAEILDAHDRGVDIAGGSFVRDALLPILAKTFRLEFLNRFDAIVVFAPLSEEGLLKIALLEVQKIEKRLVRHRIRFDIEQSALAEEIRRLNDPRFGARPVKRFIEETCETLAAQSLLA